MRLNSELLNQRAQAAAVEADYEQAKLQADRNQKLAAENLGSTDRPEPTREIVSAWLASPVHRQNLYAPAFNATGIGIVRAPDGALLYTQVYVTYPR